MHLIRSRSNSNSMRCGNIASKNWTFPFLHNHPIVRMRFFIACYSILVEIYRCSWYAKCLQRNRTVLLLRWMVCYVPNKFTDSRCFFVSILCWLPAIQTNRFNFVNSVTCKNAIRWNRNFGKMLVRIFQYTHGKCWKQMGKQKTPNKKATNEGERERNDQEMCSHKFKLVYIW